MVWNRIWKLQVSEVRRPSRRGGYTGGKIQETVRGSHCRIPCIGGWNSVNYAPKWVVFGERGFMFSRVFEPTTIIVVGILFIGLFDRSSLALWTPWFSGCALLCNMFDSLFLCFHFDGNKVQPMWVIYLIWCTSQFNKLLLLSPNVLKTYWGYWYFFILQIFYIYLCLLPSLLFGKYVYFCLNKSRLRNREKLWNHKITNFEIL